MEEEEKKAIDYLQKYIQWETSGERSLETDIKTALDLIKKQQRQLNIKNRYLELIRDIGYDYDGFDKSDDLKELIDELVGLSRQAIKNDDWTVMWISAKNESKNILQERLDK